MDQPRSQARVLHQHLPSELRLRILSLLTPNERALGGRLVSRDAADGLCGPEHCTAYLCEPLPPYALTCAHVGEQQARRLPFTQRLSLLGTAAASGSEVNLEVALKMLQPSIFPDVLQDEKSNSRIYDCRQCLDPGVEAVSYGHPQLLAWLLRHCPGLVGPKRVLWEAAWRCELAELQSVWGTLQAAYVSGTNHANGTSGGCSSAGADSHSSSDGGDSSTDRHRPVLDQDVLDVAAESCTPDALAKVEWMLKEGAGSCRLQESTARAAAHRGDQGRLRWLRDRGCPMGGLRTLEVLLRRADLAVVQWAVDEGVCALPPEWDGEPGDWPSLQLAAAQSSDGVAKLQWLQERGSPPLQGPDNDEDDWLLDLTHAATEAGRVEVVRYLHEEVGEGRVVQRDPELFGCAAAYSKSIPMAEFVRQAGAAFTPAAFNERWMRSGHEKALQMIRWLTTEAGVAAPWMEGLGWVLRDWPNYTPADGQQQLEAVQLLVRDGTHPWNDAWGVPGVITGAAWRGNTALVQYLTATLQQPVSKVCACICHDAVYGGCEALLEWMVQEHPGCFASYCDYTGAYVSAASHGDRGTLEALRRLGVPWSLEDTLAAAVRDRCGVPALRWLMEQRMPVDWEADMDRSLCLADYDEEVQEWLRGLANAAAWAVADLVAAATTAATERTAAAFAAIAAEAVRAAEAAAAKATATAATAAAATASAAAAAAAAATAAANTAASAAATAARATTAATTAAAVMTAGTAVIAAVAAAEAVAKAVAAGAGAAGGDA